MTLRSIFRYSRTHRCTYSLALIALAACVGSLGCGDDRKFEARRTPRISRTAPRHDAPLPTADAENHIASMEAEPIPERPRNCAPDAVLTAGERVSPSEPVDGGRMARAARSAAQWVNEPADVAMRSSTGAPSTSGSCSTIAATELDAPGSPLNSQASLPSLALSSNVAASGDEAALVRQAEEHNRRGLAWASKGAVFTARKEFQAALLAVAAALDIQEAMQRHRTALASGLNALTELEDFAALERVALGPSDLATTVAGHTSQVVSVEAAVEMTAATLRELYTEFAVERLAFAAASPTGSVALHRLGKASLAGGSTSAPATRVKARAFLEAALRIDANNFPAANDLAVHLAEDGYYDRALSLLRDGLARSPQPALWTNLAAIHDLRGEAQLAQAARLEARSLAGRGAAGVVPMHNVAWVDARTFAAASQPNTEMQSPTNRSSNAAQQQGGVASNASKQPTARQIQAPPPATARQPISTANSLRRNAMVQ